MSTLHVLGLPWTTTTPEFSQCAYTQKLLKFGDMMTGRSRRVVLYTGGGANTAQCDEHVPVFDNVEREIFFGAWTPEQITNGTVTWDVNAIPWRVFNHRLTKLLRARLAPNDLILVTGGNCHRPVTDAFPDQLACEWAVGYEGIYLPFCAFESHVWRHHVYGLQQQRFGRAYDTVINNFFDPLDFVLGTDPREYLLYLGRVNGKKGVHVAWQIAQAANLPLVIAGPGATADRHGELITISGDGFEPFTGPASMLTYTGAVLPTLRAALLSRAIALLCPTQYIEPFGGAAIEAMLSGTPVVASNWGAFVETVTPDVGSRYNTLAEAVSAIAAVQALDPPAIRAAAVRRYSLHAIAPQFDRWFDQLDGLRTGGWATLPANNGSGVNSTA